jgi:RNA polymerase subunit RPABC4/transcription elongation factor Spt4
MVITCMNCQTQLTPQQAGEPCPVCGSMDRNLRVEDRAIATEKAKVAKELAKKHYQVEPGLTHVIRCSGAAEIEFGPAEPIKLLEVNENTVPAGVMPLHFGPAPASGITFPSIIVEVTPDEFEKIKKQELALPAGWGIDAELPRPTD